MCWLMFSALCASCDPPSLHPSLPVLGLVTGRWWQEQNLCSTVLGSTMRRITLKITVPAVSHHSPGQIGGFGSCTGQLRASRAVCATLVMLESQEQENLLGRMLGSKSSAKQCSSIWVLQNLEVFSGALCLQSCPGLKNSVTGCGCNVLQPQEGDLKRGSGTLTQDCLTHISLQSCLSVILMSFLHSLLFTVTFSLMQGDQMPQHDSKSLYP